MLNTFLSQFSSFIKNENRFDQSPAMLSMISSCQCQKHLVLIVSINADVTKIGEGSGPIDCKSSGFSKQNRSNSK